MNKIYMFTLKDFDIGWYYIAAKNWKEARRYARTQTEMNEYNDDEAFLSYRGHLVKKDGKVVYTEDLGALDIDQIIANDIHWWDCWSCGSKNVRAINSWQYRCLNCTEIGNIPYYD